MSGARRGALPIVALDVGSRDEALALARRVGPAGKFFKVGSELFTAAGPDVVRALRDELGADVFLDLKFNDIPNTVAGVHASGGRAMLDAAQAAWLAAGGAAAGEGGLLAVTVLTSFDSGSLGAAWGRTAVDVEREVVRLAGDVAGAGLHGIVCSGAEAAAVRAAHGDRLALLVPGIRLAGGALHDQRRVMTPDAAQAAGARYLILGRAVTGEKEPAAALERVIAALG
jgi:orotidine-5'-phosphate decarboxylase